MIRALVFDFDGLILDTETPVIDAWIALHQEAGVAYQREHAMQIVGHVDVPFDPWVAFAADADRQALDVEHRKRSRALLLQQTVLPGVETLLRSGRDHGLQLGIASNSTHAWVDKHLQRLGLFELFHVIKCRDDVSRGKPDPELYQLVVSALGVQPNEAVAFEDSAPGSLAAKEAGLWCVGVPNPSTIHHELRADLRLNSLADASLDDLLRRFNG